MNPLKRHILTSIIGTALAAAPMISLSSCNALNEHLEECPEGARLRFIYDRNMDFANAFPSQVDCLTVLVYDENGNYIQTRTETSDILSDENYRMTVDLPAGKYTFVAYGGMACAESSFHFVEQPSASLPLPSLEVQMDQDCITSPDGTLLHDLFYGILSLEIPENSIDYTEGTVEMMKDTNNVRIVLQHIDGTPVNEADFTFRVTADNTLFDYKNNLIPVGNITFCPWAHDNAYAGLVIANTEDEYDEDLHPVQVAYAEFSLSRFIYKDNINLEITRNSDGSSIFSKPLSLLNYLMLSKSDKYRDMPPQEYLDRESRWSLILLLDKNNYWISTTIVINDWIVRINNPEF